MKAIFRIIPLIALFPAIILMLIILKLDENHVREHLRA